MSQQDELEALIEWDRRLDRERTDIRAMPTDMLEVYQAELNDFGAAMKAYLRKYPREHHEAHG